MDPNRQPISNTPTPSDPDLDLARLLYKTGQTIKSVLRTIFRGFEQLILTVLSFLLFLVKNTLWLALGAALGFAYGFYVRKTKGTQYESQMIVRANYNSSRTLYSSIDYYNALIATGKWPELIQHFGLKQEEAATIERFSVEPVESEIITAEMYKDMFLNNDHGTSFKKDTTWLRTLSYKDFKKSLTKYDYPLQEISITSTNPVIFARLQDGILHQVNSIPLLNQLAKARTATNADEEKVIQSAIASIDSLRDAYNQRLKSGRSTTTEGNQFFFSPSNNSPVTPELQVYDKLLDLQDELKRNRSKSVTETNVLEVYSPFNAVGKEVALVRRAVFRHTTTGLIAAIFIVSLLSLYQRGRGPKKSNKLA